METNNNTYTQDKYTKDDVIWKAISLCADLGIKDTEKVFYMSAIRQLDMLMRSFFNRTELIAYINEKNIILRDIKKNFTIPFFNRHDPAEHQKNYQMGLQVNQMSAMHELILKHISLHYNRIKKMRCVY